MFSNSRTLPGQEYSESSFAADAPNDLGGEVERSKKLRQQEYVLPALTKGRESNI